MDPETAYDFKKAAIRHGLISMGNKLGRNPTIFDLEGNTKRQYIRYREIVSYFGSWQKALYIAGLIEYNEFEFEDCHDREGCAYWLREWSKQLGRPPHMQEAQDLFYNAYNLRDECLIRFGSWEYTLEAAGLT